MNVKSVLHEYREYFVHIEYVYIPSYLHTNLSLSP